jgi:hypothetical protein
VHGLEAHAGICPERGISAVQVASEAIAGMRLGRVDAETTANLGVMHGGLATNIVPSQVVVRGETRSLSEAKLAAQTEHMRARFEEAAARHAVTLEGREHRARVDIQVERQYERLSIGDDTAIVRLVAEAARALGRVCPTRSTGGGSDANVFVTRGIEVANLACGMRDIHTVNEWVDVKDLVATAEALIVGQKFGLDGAVMTRVLNASTGRNNTTENKAERYMLSRKFDSGFALALMEKDVGMARRLAEELGIGADELAFVSAYLGKALGALGKQADHTAVLQYAETVMPKA